MSDYAETIRRSTQRASREKLRSPEMVQTGRAVRPGGAGGGFRLPDYPQVTITDDTPSQLVKATHENRWLWCNISGAPEPAPITADKDFIMPPNPVKEDIYYFMSVGDLYHLHIYPGAGQTIIMPNGVLTPSQYVDLDAVGLTAMMNMLILACSAANTWICCDATHTSYGP